MEIESRLLPCGLHTIGKPATAEEAIATLVSIASIEREDDGIRSLPGLLAESKGKTIEEVYEGNNKGKLEDVELNKLITETSREAVGSMVRSLTGRDGRVNMKKNIWTLIVEFLRGIGFSIPSPWQASAKKAGFENINQGALDKVFDYLRFCLEQI